MDEMSKLIRELDKLNEGPKSPWLVRDTRGREIKDDKSSAVVYVQDEDPSTKSFIIKGYQGKRDKADFYNRYSTLERMNNAIDVFFNTVRLREKTMADRKLERASKVRELLVGDILVASWGYDMTIVDCFQVVQLIGDNSVGVKPIGKEYVEWDDWSGQVKPKRDDFTSNEITKYRVINGNSIKINSVAHARKWDGQHTYYENHLD